MTQVKYKNGKGIKIGPQYFFCPVTNRNFIYQTKSSNYLQNAFKKTQFLPNFKLKAPNGVINLSSWYPSI